MNFGEVVPEKKVKTVRDIKNEFKARFGSDLHTEEQKILWAKLNKLGGRNIDKMPPETVPDIDATVELSDEESEALEEEMNKL